VLASGKPRHGSSWVTHAGRYGAQGGVTMLELEMSEASTHCPQPTTYVKGSSRDDTGGTTLLIGGGAAAIAGLVLAAGLIGSSGNAGQGTSAVALPCDEQ
jgi:hypothetical protein